MSTYRCKCPDSGSNKVGINVLRFIDFPPIVACLTVEGSDPLQPGRWGSVGYIAGHFQGLVCACQTQAVHRIRLCCLTRRHVEESWIEETRFVNEAAKRSMACISDFPGRVIMRFHVESIFGHLWTDGSIAVVKGQTEMSYLFVNIQTGFEQIPKLFMVGCVREPTRHTNNGKLRSLRSSWRIAKG